MSQATVQRSRAMEDCSRSWRRKPESPFADGGTATWLEEADRSLCRDGTSATRVK